MRCGLCMGRDHSDDECPHDDDGFAGYCRTLTDDQVLAVLEKEREGMKRDPDRAEDFRAALSEVRERGLS